MRTNFENLSLQPLSAYHISEKSLSGSLSAARGRLPSNVRERREVAETGAGGRREAARGDGERHRGGERAGQAKH